MASSSTVANLTIDNTTVSRTSNSCKDCTIVGGVVFSATTSPAVGEGTLTVTGLTVSGTTNGTVTGTPTIGGGVIANTGSNGTLAGLNVSNTINITTTSGVYGAAVFSNTWTQLRRSTITGTTDTFKTGGGALGVIGLTSAGSLTGVSVSGTTVNAGGPSAIFGGAIDVGTTDTPCARVRDAAPPSPSPPASCSEAQSSRRGLPVPSTRRSLAPRSVTSAQQ